MHLTYPQMVQRKKIEVILNKEIQEFFVVF